MFLQGKAGVGLEDFVRSSSSVVNALVGQKVTNISLDRMFGLTPSRYNLSHHSLPFFEVAIGANFFGFVRWPARISKW